MDAARAKAAAKPSSLMRVAAAVGSAAVRLAGGPAGEADDDVTEMGAQQADDAVWNPCYQDLPFLGLRETHAC